MTEIALKDNASMTGSMSSCQALLVKLSAFLAIVGAW
jgi:hypothetical protein